MIKEIFEEAKGKMKKSIIALESAFARVRTGRAHPSLLDAIMVPYYGTPTQLKQIANISVEEGRTLVVSPWEPKLIPDIEKALQSSDLGINPATSGQLIRIPLPPLTEETRKNLIKVVKQEAEQARVAVRNIRREAISDLKELLKEKEISEDEEHKGQEDIQKLTNEYIAQVDQLLQKKEADLLAV